MALSPLPAGSSPCCVPPPPLCPQPLLCPQCSPLQSTAVPMACGSQPSPCGRALPGAGQHSPAHYRPTEHRTAQLCPVAWPGPPESRVDECGGTPLPTASACPAPWGTARSSMSPPAPRAEQKPGPRVNTAPGPGRLPRSQPGSLEHREPGAPRCQCRCRWRPLSAVRAGPRCHGDRTRLQRLPERRRRPARVNPLGQRRPPEGGGGTHREAETDRVRGRERARAEPGGIRRARSGEEGREGFSGVRGRDRDMGQMGRSGARR